MNVKRIGWLGVRSDDVEGATRFFRDVLGLEAVGDSDGASFTRLPTGEWDLVEVFPRDWPDTRMIPDGVEQMVAFVVDDLEEAAAEVRAAGLELGDVIWAAEAFDEPSYEGFGWFFVRAPDGRLYAIEQQPS